MNNIYVREPTLEDEAAFLDAMHRSLSLHSPWITSPQTPKEFSEYFKRYQQSCQKSFLAFYGDNIVGVFDIIEIVRGPFQNAYLGFYVVADYAGQGHMSTGLKIVLKKAFEEMALHRLEANIQPDNVKSIRLVRNNGFRKEGFSPRYLKVNHEWRDHERWAITVEDFNAIHKTNSNTKIKINFLCENDIEEIVSAFNKIGWNKPKSLYDSYLNESEHNTRTIFVARNNGQFCGYVTVKWKSDYQSFCRNRIPEISDLNVLPHFRKKGIGTKLIRICEQNARERGYKEIGLGVGMTIDYGNAQRLYNLLGFIPDGNGLHYKTHVVNYAETVKVDDDLVIYHKKYI